MRAIFLPNCDRDCKNGLLSKKKPAPKLIDAGS